MKIDEAIKLLDRWQNGKDITSFDDVNRAVKLGIEALKRVRDIRQEMSATRESLLPGEAEETTNDPR